jgi:hypothetical protein
MHVPQFSAAGRWCLQGILGISCLGFAIAADLASPSQAAVDAAIASQFIRFNRNIAGGAHTNGAWNGGASIALAVASHAGNTTADVRLLQQIRYTLTAGNEPTANGGYPSQHEKHVTGMFVIAKNTPRIWSQLSAAEKPRIDLIMKATFVASAFTTSDNNPYVKAGTQQYALDGDSNLNRGWNPNYREGMIGGILVGMAYFGGPAAADAILANYNHSPFVADLNANGLPNAYETFNWKAANPSSAAPSGSMIEAAVRSYRFFGLTLADYLRIYQSLAGDTYQGTVNAGLNNGAGINGAGRIVSGADTLPNKGVQGMLKEFASIDANGPRSSLIYAFDGYRPHMTNQLALIVGGYWPKGDAIVADAVTRMNIGNTDFWYKAEKGYIGYAKGQSQGLADYATHAASYGFAYNRSLWDDVLKPYHGLAGGGVVAEFPAGARIETDTSANVRAAASSGAALAGTLPAGSFGTVLAGPVTADAIEWWQVYFDNNLTGWIDRVDFAAAPASEFLTATAGGGWRNLALPAQTGSFSMSFNMRPGSSGMDGVTGLSNTSATAYADLAVAVRFSAAGVVDARNGAAYQAANPLNYQAGVTYRVGLTVNVAARTYSATVTPPAGVPVVIARDFAFRTEQAAVTSLGNLAVVANSGSQTTSGIVLEAAGKPPSAPTGLRVIPD